MPGAVTGQLGFVAVRRITEVKVDGNNAARIAGRWQGRAGVGDLGCRHRRRGGCGNVQSVDNRIGATSGEIEKAGLVEILHRITATSGFSSNCAEVRGHSRGWINSVQAASGGIELTIDRIDGHVHPLRRGD